MNRKDFLGSSACLFAGTVLPRGEKIESTGDNLAKDNEPLPLAPPYLRKGDYVGITSPAGFISLEEIQPSIRLIEDCGYNVKVG